MKLTEKYLTEAVKDRIVPAKDFLVVLQALYKAEHLCKQLKSEGSLDPKAWLNPIQAAIKILEKINMKS